MEAGCKLHGRPPCGAGPWLSGNIQDTPEPQGGCNITCLCRSGKKRETRTYICDHRHRHVFTLDGPVHLICKLNHCPDPRCPGHSRTKSPEIEPSIALPGWAIAWDVFCWIGHRRFSRHWAIPQIRSELLDAYAI